MAVPSSLTLANRTDLKYSLVWLVTILQQRPLPKHPNSEVLFSSVLEDCQKRVKKQGLRIGHVKNITNPTKAERCNNIKSYSLLKVRYIVPPHSWQWHKTWQFNTATSWRKVFYSDMKGIITLMDCWHLLVALQISNVFHSVL